MNEKKPAHVESTDTALTENREAARQEEERTEGKRMAARPNPHGD